MRHSALSQSSSSLTGYEAADRLRTELQPLLAHLSTEEQEKLNTAFDRANRGTSLLEAKYHRAIRDRAAVHALLKKASEDLVQRYQILFENSGTAMVVIENDGTISLANTLFLNLLGYRREDVENRINFLAIFDERFRDQGRDYHLRRRAGDKTVPHRYEAQLISSKGKILDAIIMIGLFLGTSQSVVSIIDITDRKRTEKALQESEERFRAIFNATFQFTGLMKPDGTLIEANQTAMDYCGTKPDQIINKPFWEAPLWRGNEKRVRKLRNAITRAAGGEFVRYEVELQGTGDTRGLFDFSIKPVFDRNGNVVLLIPEGRDITERKRVEQSLLRKNEELNEANMQLAAVEQELRQQYDELASNQKLLEESEARFHSVFNNAYDAIFIHLMQDGVPGRFLEVNEFLCTALGYTREELLARGVKDILSEAHLKEEPEISRTIFEKGFNTFYAEFRRKDGSPFPVEVNARRYQFSGQDVILSVARDITEWKLTEEEILRTNKELNTAYEQLASVDQELRTNYENLAATEKKLRESEAWSREFAELLPQSVYEVDTAGRILFVNQVAANVFGITREMLDAGLNMRDVIIPEEWERAERRMAQIATAGTKTSPEMYHCRRKDGFLMTANIYTAPVYRDGTLAGFRGIVVDITDALRAQEALQKSETRFRELAELLPQIVFELDQNLKFTFFNRNTIEMTGHTYEDLSQNSAGIFDIIEQSDRLPAERFFARILQDSASGHLECGLVTLDGREIRAIIYASPIIGEDRVAGIRGVIVDISDQKRLEAALATTNQKLQMMNSLTRHDVLNNITGLLGLVDMLGEITPESKAQVLISEIHDLINTVKDQIIFTRDYQSVGVKAPRWQSLCEGIRNAVSAIGRDTVQVKLPGSDAEIYADPFFGRVFYNLIDNSIRHGESVRTISIETEVVPEGSLLIRYRDDGTGVPPEEKELIFNQGYGKNTGFGLFIIREILEITGLTIRETGVFGSGVRFEITVPKEAWRPCDGKEQREYYPKSDA